MKTRMQAMIVFDRKGAAAIIVAIVLVVLISFAALAIDTGYLMVTRNELQNIADAAALAGARTLGRLYECNGDIDACPGAMSADEQWNYIADVAAIRQSVADVASRNHAGGKDNIVINVSDIVIGNWDAAGKTINPVTNLRPDAVRVTARRDASANSPVATFFASIFDRDTMSATANATAALTGQSTAGEGALPLPVAINKRWMSTLPCNQNLTLYPSSDEVCAAWHVYDAEVYKDNAASMAKMIQDITAGSFSSPATIAGETQYEFNNGTAAKLFKDEVMPELFNTMKVLNDGVLDMDDNPDTWTTSVPVYEDDTAYCRPNGSITIVGFANVTITDVVGSPEKTVYATVVCDLIDSGRGSGGNYGTSGSIPGLVQ